MEQIASTAASKHTLRSLVKSNTTSNILKISDLCALIETITIQHNTAKPIKEVHTKGLASLKSVLAFLQTISAEAEKDEASPFPMEDLKHCVRSTIIEVIGKVQIPQRAPSYAEIAGIQSTPIRTVQESLISVPKHIVRIKSKDKVVPMRDLREIIKEKVELDDHIAIEQMRIGSDAITISCASAEGKKELLERVNKQAEELQVEVEDKQIVKRNPCIIITGIPSEVDHHEVAEAVRKAFHDDIEFLYARKPNPRGHKSIILRCPKSEHEWIVKQGKFYFKWECFKIYEHIQVTICFKCQGYGHRQSECRSEFQSCSYCAESHDSRLCNNKNTIKCSSCVKSNLKRGEGSKLDVKHRCHSQICPIYGSALFRAKQMIAT
ncbi:hypothetical protein HDE_04956 [Halotydeus destructor]|nr:hypothetical protein HDE_04956 [Halotydeus destructor]